MSDDPIGDEMQKEMSAELYGSPKGDEALVKLEFEGVERECIPVNLFSFGEPGPEHYILTCRNHPLAKYSTKNPYQRHLHLIRNYEGGEFEFKECECPFNDLVVVQLDEER